MMQFDDIVSMLESVFGEPSKCWTCGSEAFDDESFFQEAVFRRPGWSEIFIEGFAKTTWLRYYDDDTLTFVQCFDPSESLIAALCAEARRGEWVHR